MNKINVLDKGFVCYIDHYGSDQRIVETARVSYDAQSKGEEKDKKLLHYLYKHRHTSPFEQVKITFTTKLPLFVQAQIVRHRTQNINQVSARYTEMPDEFYIPDSWRKQDTVNKQGSTDDGEFNPILGERTFKSGIGGIQKILNSSEILEYECEKMYGIYKSMIEEGISREMARMVLPQNLYTEIRTTWDLHNLMHFLRLRMDSHAQWEVQQYANAMHQITKDVFPWTIQAFDKYSWEIKENHL